MNCNSNTMPIINNGNTSCNNGCAPKDINVSCRIIIVPNGQNILGVQSDSNSISRTFVLPKETEEGIDLSDKSFVILLENSNQQQWKETISINDIDILENYIKIKWNVSNNATAVAGNLKLSIQAVGDNFKWETYSTTFIIQPSLSGDGEIEPPLNLQDKEVVSTAETQIVKPDYGFNGLSQVTVFGSSNLIPSNILEGVDIFGVIGTLQQGIDTSQFRTLAGLYSGNRTVEEIKGLNITNIISCAQTFYNCASLKVITFSGIANNTISTINSMFYGCSSLENLELNNFNFSNNCSANQAFYNCSNLQTITLNNCDFSTISAGTQMFSTCSKLQSIIGEIDFSGANGLSNAFQGCASLVNLQIKNLKTTLDLSACNNLSYESLIYIINNLQTVTSSVTLTLGATNRNKLTEEEIAIATNKGWNII